MKKRSKVLKCIILSNMIFFLMAVIYVAPAWSHFPWINATDYTPADGAALELNIGWGHAYPFAPFLKKGSVEELNIQGPDKDCPKLSFASDIEIKSEECLTKPGAYIISAIRTPGFYSKTTQGGKQSSKKGLSNVLSCSFSHMCMKAIVNVGDGKGQTDISVGHPMEILLLKNPVDVDTGDNMPIKVLYKGKPWSGMIYATYAGFSTEKETFAYTTKTDKLGQANIRMLHSGVWLLKVSQSESYPDVTECDTENYVASLTFEVK